MDTKNSFINKILDKQNGFLLSKRKIRKYYKHNETMYFFKRGDTRIICNRDYQYFIDLISYLQKFFSTNEFKVYVPIQLGPYKKLIRYYSLSDFKRFL